MISQTQSLDEPNELRVCRIGASTAEDEHGIAVEVCHAPCRGKEARVILGRMYTRNEAEYDRLITCLPFRSTPGTRLAVRPEPANIEAIGQVAHPLGKKTEPLMLRTARHQMLFVQ